MNDLYFACTDCKVYINAGYRWAYWNLLKSGVVDWQATVEVDRVLAASEYWSPPQEPDSDWLFNDVFPPLRKFLAEHRRHHIVFWDMNNLPDDTDLNWLQLGWCPRATGND